MTQQVNLYAREVEVSLGPLLVAAMALVVVAAALVAYWQMLASETNTAQRQLVRAKADLAAQQVMLKGMKDVLATRTDPARLAAELAAVKTRASEAQEIMGQLQRGELGTLDGYGGHLVKLARIGEPGIWITGLRIQNAGRNLAVDGRSLQAESILRYAGELNRQFAAQGVRLSSVEMTPVQNADSAAAVTFKLY